MSSQRFRYSLFGLTLESELEFPELPIVSSNTDVIVRMGDVPAHLASPVCCGVLFESGTDGYLLRVPGTASYWAREGKQVVIKCEPDVPEAHVRAFFLGSVMTAILHQRGTLVLHAAGVVGSRGAVLFAGNSGIGKSTLLAALSQRGYRPLTDDVAAITVGADNTLCVHPGVPQARLWKDTAARLGYSLSDLSRARVGVEKYVLSLRDGFSTIPQPLAALFVLAVGNNSKVIVEPVKNAERFNLVRANTRNLRVLEGLEMQAAHFALAAAVASRVPIAQLIRPKDVDSLDDLLAQIDPSLA